MAKDKKDWQDAESVDAPLFFGTLRSEFDTEEELAPTWMKLMSTAEAVRLAYSRGELAAQQAAEGFAELRLKDHTGAEWTVGATSGEWYRRFSSSASWARSAPPSMVEAAPEGQAWLEEGFKALFPAPEDGSPLPVQVSEEPEPEVLNEQRLPQEYAPEQADFDADLLQIEAAEFTPAPREKSVSYSDVLGWQPMRREDGPELPDIEPEPDEERLDDTPERDTSFDYSQALSAFMEGMGAEAPESTDPSEESVEPGGEPDADGFELPDDLFYRPQE